jgi:hypothetical protein
VLRARHASKSVQTPPAAAAKGPNALPEAQPKRAA